ncbi:retrovirus-related pol polyprotein from transposon TNT 1-94, partial [Tanacetum coccineum]
MKIKESLNVAFDETPPPSKTSPLVDDDLDEEEAIKVTEKRNFENDIEDETLVIDEIVNIKESRNHPLENVIGNLNQRTLRFEKKAKRKMKFNNKDAARFDKKKVKCYKCSELGHFARECTGKQLDSKARYSSFKLKELDKSKEPKAFLSVDSMLNYSCFDANFLVAELKFMKVAFGDGFKMLLSNPL